MYNTYVSFYNKSKWRKKYFYPEYFFYKLFFYDKKKWHFKQQFPQDEQVNPVP